MSRSLFLRTILRHNLINKSSFTTNKSTTAYYQYKSLSTSTVLAIQKYNNKRRRSNSVSNTSLSDAMLPPTKKQAAEQSYGVAKNGVEMKIMLSDKEARICNLLEQVSDYIAQTRSDLPRIESRIAGGWVRDKLLGKDCHDLDVAVNDMMGYEFATYVNEYLKANGYPIRSIAKIDSNPAKSKHLETATTKLFDQEVDFANLRTEVYEENSRIPTTIAFGTPTEDAYRRDITINSLFYNVNTKRVEDFTEKGLYDLQHGLVRTPLEPFETFRDDPLRVLRCVRFASRFNFELVPELIDTVKNEVIRDALETKISRERIGIELEKMMTGPSPLYAIQMLHQLGLYKLVFEPPASITAGTVSDSSLAVRAVGAVQWLSSQDFEKLQPQSNDERRSLYLNSALLPFLGVSTEFKKRNIPAVHLVLRDSIKFSNNDMNASSTLFRGVPMFEQAVNNNEISRSELGMIIREMGNLWGIALKLSLVNELLQFHSDVQWDKPETIQVTESEICKKYHVLYEKAENYGITRCYQWKTMLDGKKVATVLGIRPGPGMSELMNQIMIWQLEHPDGTEDECKEMIKNYWETRQI